MNDRKRAWQILQNEIRRRADDRELSDVDNRQFGAIIKDADSELDVIIELAGFGATFALMDRTPEQAKALVDQIGAGMVMEPDVRCWPGDPAPECEGCEDCAD